MALTSRQQLALHNLNFHLNEELRKIEDKSLGENLKLPICPKCFKTEHILETVPAIWLAREITYPLFECKACQIKWNAKEGLIKKRK